MKALSLWQPWASLVALGVKTIETRSWQTSYRGPLAVHAGARRPPSMHLPPLRGRNPEPSFLVIDTITAPEHQRPHRTDIRDRVPKWATTPTLFFPRRGPFGRPHKEGVPATEQGSAVYLPLGAVVATCTLVDIVPTQDLYWTGFWPRWAWQLRGAPLYPPQTSAAVKNLSVVVPDNQRPYGDFSPGRFAWLLADVEPLAEPVPSRGRQGLWEWAA